MESYLHVSEGIVLIIVYIMDSVYVQKLVFPVLLLLVPSMESHKINFVVLATNKFPYGLSVIILWVWHCHFFIKLCSLYPMLPCLALLNEYYYYYFPLFLKGSEPKGPYVHLVGAFLEMKLMQNRGIETFLSLKPCYSSWFYYSIALSHFDILILKSFKSNFN